MRRFLARTADFIRESDKILLVLCVFASLYGCLAVFSATHYLENYRPVIIHLLCTVMGVVAAVIISAIDYEKMLKREINRLEKNIKELHEMDKKY